MNTSQDFIFNPPTKEDGWAVAQLISRCPPLDKNSVYCNLLQCHHFSQTSITAKQENKLVGFTSGYVIPGRPDTLFIWQVAVRESARHGGLASQMIEHILARPNCRSVCFLETTITEENDASWALFHRIAEHYSSPLSKESLFDQDLHFSGHHDSETLVRIGPFKP